MRPDCCMCPPVELWVIISTASVLRCRIVKLDVKSAFIQTGLADRQVYIIPPFESTRRNELWLLLTAAYGLENANAKLQVQSASSFHSWPRACFFNSATFRQK